MPQEKSSNLTFIPQGFPCLSSEEDLDSHCFLESSPHSHTLARGELPYESSLGKSRLFQAETGKENPHFWIKSEKLRYTAPQPWYPSRGFPYLLGSQKLFSALNCPWHSETHERWLQTGMTFLLILNVPNSVSFLFKFMPEASISTLANSLAFLGIYILRLVSCPHLHWFLGLCLGWEQEGDHDCGFSLNRW